MGGRRRVGSGVLPDRLVCTAGVMFAGKGCRVSYVRFGSFFGLGESRRGGWIL